MLRVSDAERQVAQELLRRHHLDGRLTVDEFDDRCGRAQAAVTRADLDAVQADLPPLTAAPPARLETEHAAAPPGPVSWKRGSQPFAERIDLAGPADDALERTVHHIAPAMAHCGYELIASTATWLEFVRRRRPVWTILVAIFLFPIGLIALVHREERRVTVLLERGPGGCTITARGEAPLPVRQAFAELRA
jgi:hypothetical protein